MATVLSRPCLCSTNRKFGTSPCSSFIVGSFWGILFSPQCGKLPGHSSPSIKRACRSLEGQGIFEIRDSFAAYSKERLHVFQSCQDQALYERPIDRRAALALFLLASFEPLQFCNSASAADEEVKLPLNLESYVDEKEGFILLKPTQWTKVEKAGATVLFEDPQSKGNNVGVVVNPVRIKSLSEFGTVDIVADKLLQAEKRKPSTNDVQLIKANERQAHGGAPLYQLEYKLDSSRGIKRILSAVTVASKKLYILNVAYADTSEKPLQPDMASLLEQIVNSFDVL